MSNPTNDQRMTSGRGTKTIGEQTKDIVGRVVKKGQSEIRNISHTLQSGEQIYIGFTILKEIVRFIHLNIFFHFESFEGAKFEIVGMQPFDIDTKDVVSMSKPGHLVLPVVGLFFEWLKTVAQLKNRDKKEKIYTVYMNGVIYGLLRKNPIRYSSRFERQIYIFGIAQVDVLSDKEKNALRFTLAEIYRLKTPKPMSFTGGPSRDNRPSLRDNAYNNYFDLLHSLHFLLIRKEWTIDDFETDAKDWNRKWLDFLSFWFSGKDDKHINEFYLSKIRPKNSYEIMKDLLF